MICIPQSPVWNPVVCDDLTLRFLWLFGIYVGCSNDLKTAGHGSTFQVHYTNLLACHRRVYYTGWMWRKGLWANIGIGRACLGKIPEMQDDLLVCDDMGWERPPLTVTQAHKWWESDISLVLASKDISVKVIRGKGGYYCKPRGQVWAEPVRHQTRERISTNGCISKTSRLAILTNMLVSDLMWFLIPHALPLKRQ